MNAGTVYIVGAGPGDPQLISVRGQRYLAAADVVIHDRLVHPRLLDAARSDAEKIEVGEAAPQSLDQDAISLLLAEKAREGRVVVRLKWGDPFVFDSGGKEAIFLHEQGIPFEVVPGVTAPVAAPTYAGVPVTYPGAGDTLTFVRGHEDGSNRALRVDWTTLAKLGGTVVCYAGPRQLPGIVDAVLAHGRSEDDWAALVIHGTLPQQDTFHGTLGEIKARLKKSNGLRWPAILVVGAVAGLREHLRWFDARPLFGKRVLVTRSREQADELVELLEDLGAETVEVPSITIATPADYAPLDAACQAAETYHWIVFTSGYAVESFLRRLLAGPRDVRSLKGPRLCAIGPVTIDRLHRVGLKTDVRMVEYRPENIIEAMQAHGSLAGSRVLFPRSDSPHEVLSDELEKAGAAIDSVTAYRTIVEPYDEADQDIYKMLLDGQVNVAMFTSASAIRNFAERIGREQAADLLRSTTVACIGPVTAEAAERLGIHATVVPKEYTVHALVRAVVEHCRAGAAAESPPA